MNSQPMVIAHRGGHWVDCGENTLDAFRTASRRGVRWMETDVHASADGVVFAAHDAVLDRIADRPGRLRDMQAREIDAVELVAGGRIPRLHDLFEILPQVSWNIDVKAPHSLGPTVRTIRGARAEERLRLASFDSTTLHGVRRALPGVPTSMGVGETARFLLGAGAPGGVDALQVPPAKYGLPVVSRALVRRAHRAGLEVHVWTINAERQMIRLAELGVDAIISDEVDLALRVLGRTGS